MVENVRSRRPGRSRALTLPMNSTFRAGPWVADHSRSIPATLLDPEPSRGMMIAIDSNVPTNIAMEIILRSGVL
jgi:hypothetical protein